MPTAAVPSPHVIAKPGTRNIANGDATFLTGMPHPGKSGIFCRPGKSWKNV